jgi:hypothetical protein
MLEATIAATLLIAWMLGVYLWLAHGAARAWARPAIVASS